MGPPGSLPRKDLRDPQGAPQIPPLRFASVGMTRGGPLLLARLATWMDGIRSGYAARTADPSTALRFGRDDKGRAVTHLKVCESDREFFCAIRLVELSVSNSPPLVIPSGAEGSAVRLARTQISRESSGVTCGFSPPYSHTLFSPCLSCPVPNLSAGGLAPEAAFRALTQTR